MEKTCIILDAMGGDNAPDAVVEGALQALDAIYVDVVLVGDENKIKEVLSRHKYDENRVTIVDAKEVITNEEAPVVAIRKKKNSSIVKGMNLLKDGKGQAFISAGSTGAVLAGGTFIVGRIKGIERPALGAFIPTDDGVSLLMDCGANVDSKPEYLFQFAKMGIAYYESVLNKKDVTVALVNNGTEMKKGNALTKATYKLLQADRNIIFKGNVESREIPKGFADVYVCDGFTGNIILKLYEGLATSLFKKVKEAILSGFISRIGGFLIKGSMKKLKQSMDYSEYGGAPLLGLNGLVMKCHGSSDAKSIKHAVMECYKFTDNKVNEKIKQNIFKE